MTASVGRNEDLLEGELTSVVLWRTGMADEQQKSEQYEESREILRKYGKFAVVVPPARTLLLSSTRGANAFSAVGGGPGGPGRPPTPPSPPTLP